MFECSVDLCETIDYKHKLFRRDQKSNRNDRGVGIVHSRMREENFLKRIYKKEEIASAGYVIHIIVDGEKTLINEYAIEKVSAKVIRFTDRIEALKSRQIPITSIGFAYEAEMKGYRIQCNGMCLPADHADLMKTIQKMILRKRSEVLDIIDHQIDEFAERYSEYVAFRDRVAKEQENQAILKLESTVKMNEDEEDEFFYEACFLAVTNNGISTSLIQRKFKIGYNRAATIMELMEKRGVVGGSNGSKPREVLISEEDLLNKVQLV